MVKYKLIGVTGKAGSGKSTFGTMLKNEFEKAGIEYDLYAFANSLKAMLSAGLNIDSIDLENQFSKNNKTFYGVTLRRLMQTLGTEWGRKLVHENIWIELLKQKIKGNAIITDVRFENEAAWIRKNGGIIYHVHRDVINRDSHCSERSLRIEKGDFELYNTHSLTHLIKVVSDLVKYVLL